MAIRLSRVAPTCCDNLFLIHLSLCATCRYGRQTTNDRASVFLLCELALHDSAYPKYPRLPVLHCAGYKEKPCPTPTTATAS